MGSMHFSWYMVVILGHDALKEHLQIPCLTLEFIWD